MEQVKSNFIDAVLWYTQIHQVVIYGILVFFLCLNPKTVNNGNGLFVVFEEKKCSNHMF